jgi:hypothetical protein
MHFPILLWLNLMFQRNIFGSGTHTHKHIPTSYTVSATHQTANQCLRLTEPPANVCDSPNRQPMSATHQTSSQCLRLTKPPASVCDSPNRQPVSETHQTARTQDVSTCRPLSAGVKSSSTRGILLFLLHWSILLKQDTCSAVVQICHHNIHFMERVVSLPCLQETHIWITKFCIIMWIIT